MDNIIHSATESSHWHCQAAQLTLQPTSTSQGRPADGQQCLSASEAAGGSLRGCGCLSGRSSLSVAARGRCGGRSPAANFTVP
jgi:hypothetical protein